MEGNKSFFHAITISLENLLREYKRQYPMNVGDLLAKAFPILLLIFTVVLPLGCFFTGIIDNVIYIWSTAAAFFFCMALFAKAQRKDTGAKLLSDIHKLKEQIEPLADYPDVRDYLNDFNAELENIINAKQQLTKVYRWLLLSLILVGAVTFCLILYLGK